MISVYRFIYLAQILYPVVSRASKAEAPARHSATHQKLEEGAWEIIKDGQIVVLDQNRHHVSSMNTVS